MSFGSKFKFHSNIFFKKTSLKKVLPFHQNIFFDWTTLFSSSPETPDFLLLQFLWCKMCIQIEDNPVYSTKFAAENIIFLISTF